MIDEKKLIEELRGRIKTPRSTMEIIRDIIPMVERQPKVDDWILCSVRLPENGDYLICDDEGNVYASKYRNGCWLINASANHVVAWMPLPKPYKESENDEGI